MKNFCKTLGIAAVMGVQLMMLHSCCKHNSSDDDMRVLPIVMNTVQAGTKAIIDNPDGEERLKQMMNACYMEYKDRHPNCSALELKDVFDLLLALSLGTVPDTVGAISDEGIKVITELWTKNVR